MADSILKSPADPIASPPEGYKGSGNGVFDGIKVAGLPGRTMSAGSIPEKMMDEIGPPPSNKQNLIKTPADTNSAVAGVQSTSSRK